MSLAERLTDVPHSAEILAGLDTMLGGARTATGADVAWAFRRLVETLAGRRPVVLVVDDLQWAEQGLIDLLDHLTDMSRGAPILLVGMARPEFRQARPGWGAGRQHAFTMSLRPLSDADCQELTAELLGGVGEALVAKVAAASEGVPLFVEEFTAMLVADGQLVPVGAGRYEMASGLDDVTLPPTVQALLAARLDGLAPGPRDVLDVASVIGKTFYPRAVAALGGDDLDTVSQRIEALVRADLVQPVATDLPGHDAYSFAHLLLRDAAYRAMTKARRAALHQAVAEWFDEQPAPAVSSEVVAFHLEAATTYLAELGSPDIAVAEEAAQRLVAAADRALALGDAAAAVGLSDRAERLVPAMSRLRADVVLTQSEAANAWGDYPTAVARADEADRIGAALEDESVQHRGRLQKAVVEFWTKPTYRVDDTFALTDRAIEAFTAAGDDRGLTVAYVLRSEAHNMLGRLWAASADARLGLRHARRADRPGSYRTRLIVRLTAPYQYGDGSLLEMAEALDEISVEFADDPAMRRAVDDRRQLLLAYQGHLEEATHAMVEAYDFLLDKGSTIAAATLLTWGLAWCQRWSGDLSAAAESMAAGARLREGLGETGGRSTTLAELGVILALLGRDDEAQAVVTQSRAITQERDAVNDVNFAAAEGLLLAHRGDSDGSEATFEAGLRNVEATEFLMATGELWLARSYARESLGDGPGALAAAEQAVACFERGHQVPPIRSARARVAALAH